MAVHLAVLMSPLMVNASTLETREVRLIYYDWDERKKLINSRPGATSLIADKRQIGWPRQRNNMLNNNIIYINTSRSSVDGVW